MSDKKLEKLYKKAQNAEIEHKYEKAAKLYTKIIKKNEKKVLAYLNRAKLFKTHKFELEAYRLKLYLKLKINKEEEQFLSQKIRLIEDLFKKEKNEDPQNYHFFDDLIEIIKIDQNYVLVWLYILNIIENKEDKLKVIDIILQIEPENKSALKSQIDIFKKLNREIEYIRALKNFLRQYPNDNYALNEVGDYYLIQNDLQSAYNSFKSAKNERKAVVILCQIKKLARKGDFNSITFLSSIKVSEKTFYEEGVESFLNGKYKKAHDEFWNAYLCFIKEHNKIKATLFKLIAKYYNSLTEKPTHNLNRMNIAMVEATQKAKVKATNLIYAEIYKEAGFPEQAKLYYELEEKQKKAKEQVAESKESYYIENYYSIIKNSRNYQRAFQILQKGVENIGETISLLELRGKTLLNLGRISDARNDFEKVLKKRPNSHSALKGMALLEAQGNSYGKAIVYLKEFLKEYKKESWIDELIKNTPLIHRNGEVEDFIKKY